MVNPPVKNVVRKTWDPVSKREVANEILDGKILVKDVIRLHKLQPYQLYAWIGQAAVSRLQAEKELATRKVAARKEPLPEPVRAPVGGADPPLGKGGGYSIEDLLAFAEWDRQRRP